MAWFGLGFGWSLFEQGTHTLKANTQIHNLGSLYTPCRHQWSHIQLKILSFEIEKTKTDLELVSLSKLKKEKSGKVWMKNERERERMRERGGERERDRERKRERSDYYSIHQLRRWLLFKAWPDAKKCIFYIFLLCISTSFWLLRAPKSCSNYFFLPFSTFSV